MYVEEVSIDGQKRRFYKRRADGRKDALARQNRLVGRRFGMLTVLWRYAGASRLTGQTMWECRCQCGNETIVYGGNLTRGNTKSCGCGFPRKGRKLQPRTLEHIANHRASLMRGS